MPAIHASRRSCASATAMATALLLECARCQKSGFLSSQVRVHVVDGRELNECRECYLGLECHGKDVSDTSLAQYGWQIAYCVNKTTKALRINGGSGEHAALRRFFVDNKKVHQARRQALHS
eukprot:8384459-Karenia_brevis.AAC.1